MTFKNGRKIVEVVQQIPLEFLMTETDAPYLAPEPFRGRTNRSPYVEHVVRRIAVIKDLPYEKVAEIVFQNGCRFFGLEERCQGIARKQEQAEENIAESIQ